MMMEPMDTGTDTAAQGERWAPTHAGSSAENAKKLAAWAERDAEREAEGAAAREVLR
jgi:hypothetical protein